MPDQLPISHYGIIGDLRTAALVGLHGGIDWCCLPHFDSPSLFAAILDPERGGTWLIQPDEPFTSRQRYLPSTNILETTFRTDDAEVRLVDFMPLGFDGRPPSRHPEIHRQVTCSGGQARMRMLFAPRFDYAAGDTRVEQLRHGIFATDRRDEVATLASAEPFQWSIANATATTVFPVAEGDTRWVVLRYDDDDVHPVDRYDSARKLEVTAAFWRVWVSQLRYTGPYHKQVERSALALKLLTDVETGGIIAAPTSSLPEVLGGVRNWDYRYVWLRDAAFTLAALEEVGHHEEADNFMRFLKRASRHESNQHLQIMYRLDGRRDLSERVLDHLSGYQDSRPVRVGNAASLQLQLDVYGDVMATADIWRRYHEMTDGTWRVLRPLVDWMSKNWRLADNSIWEVRGETRHYVYSKLMSWVALDRGIRIAEALGLEGDTRAWRSERGLLRDEILQHGWSEQQQSFVQVYDDSDVLDAATLAVGLRGFLPWDDPRTIGTVRAVARGLTIGDGELVLRYRSPDGLVGQEGAFSICTFWLAESLVRIGDHRAGERIFRRMLGHANHLGLYSEEIDPETGQALGNFPQAFTHVALINCAIAMKAAGVGGPEPGEIGET
jgi:GH15 family glucan-1,4-alpha-glucosidase